MLSGDNRLSFAFLNLGFSLFPPLRHPLSHFLPFSFVWPPMPVFLLLPILTSLFRNENIFVTADV